jgi:tetratricopeptide (TPR) repeat protein
MGFGKRFGLTRYDADEYYKQALEAYRKHDLAEAINRITLAIELLPNHAEYYAARGFFYLEDGVRDKADANTGGRKGAIPDFEAALKRNKLEMLAHYGRGMIAYQDKNWQEAKAHFLDAYKAAPQRPESLYYLALAYHHNGENAQAKAFIEMAINAFKDEDKRKADAQKWQREFQRLLDQQSKVAQPPAPADKKQLPLLGE